MCQRGVDTKNSDSLHLQLQLSITPQIIKIQTLNQVRELSPGRGMGDLGNWVSCWRNISIVGYNTQVKSPNIKHENLQPQH